MTLGMNGVKAINDALLILNQIPVVDIFSDKSLSEMIEKCILGLLKEEPRNIDEKTSDVVKKFLSTLENEKAQKWNILIPLSNLKLEVEQLDVGGVLFSKKENFPEDILEKLNKRPKVEADDVTENSKGRVYAVPTVEAFDKEKALELGERLVEHALNIVRFYAFGLLGPYSMGRGRRFGIDESISWMWKKRIFLSDKTIGESHEATGPLRTFTIDSESLKTMQMNHFDKVNLILKKKDPTEFEKRLKVSINFFGAGIYELDLVDSFLDFIIALESLVLKEHDPPKGLLAERTSLIIESDSDNRKKIFDKMAELYKKRSEIVHRGNTNITIIEVYSIAHYAYLVIKNLLNHSDVIKTTEDLVNMCNNVKFGGPQFGI